MTMSWHTMMEFEPPQVGCVISNRNYSFDLLKATKECVINIPTVEIAEKAVGCGNTSGAKIDKFKKFVSRQNLLHKSERHSLMSAMQISSAGLLIQRW